MGKSYYVPRSVKGESRILIIFTIKSFVFTVVFGVVGVLFILLLSMIIPMNLWAEIIIVAIFGAIGYAISAGKIPDVPIMGPFRKAGGEYVYEIIFRFLTFKRRKKIYVYNLDSDRNINNSDKNKGGI